MGVFDEKRCTYYTHRAQPGSNRLILDILTKEGYTNTKKLNQVRQHDYGSSDYKAHKAHLSCATFSSVQQILNIPHSESNHLMHTGFIQFDIDAKDNPILKTPGGLEEIKELIIDNSPFLAYMGVSVSGLGLWGLVPIENWERHASQYKALANHFKLLSLTPDTIASNVASFRWVSYDPDAYINEEATIFDQYEAAADPEKSMTTLPFIPRPKPDDSFFLAAKDWLEARENITYRDGHRHNYLVKLTGMLRNARVGYDDIVDFVNRFVVPISEVETNAISHTYHHYLTEKPKW